MANIIIYTADYCPYCTRAKDLLTRKGQTFEEIDVTESDQLRMEMMEKSGGRKTIPQIFIDGKHVGGFDDITALDSEGGLDELLSA